MDGMHQITLEEWLSWKEDIRRKLSEAASNFVYIGFRLKQIRDSGMLDGAADIFEFALKEYGLGKSTTSRFIAINEKFSEGGNSLELRQEFKLISSSKLAEMLTLTDSECLLITDKTTVKEIRELKSFSRQQAPEGDPDGQRLSPLQKCLIDFFLGKKEMLNAVISATAEERYKDAAELMNPSGHCTHKKGICFLFMEDYNTGVKAKLLTEPAPLEMDWKEMLLEVYAVYADIFEGGERDVYGAYYAVKPSGGKPSIPSPEEIFPQENQGAGGPVATSQQDGKEAADEAVQQDSRAEAVLEPPGQDPEYEPLPGQMEITDYPDIMPEVHHEEIPVQELGPAAAMYGEKAEEPEAEKEREAEKAQKSGEPEETAGKEGQPLEYQELLEGTNTGNAVSGLTEGELIWMDVTRSLGYLAQWSSVWDHGTVPRDILEGAYRNAIDLAAAIEKLMNLKGVKNG